MRGANVLPPALACWAVASSADGISILEDTGPPMPDGPFESLVTQHCTEWLQRPVVPDDTGRLVPWKEMEVREEVPPVVDPSMCFSCHGKVRSITVWANGNEPVYAQFFMVRCRRGSPNGRGIRCRAAEITPFYRRGNVTNSPGMVSFQLGGRLPFSPGDCLGLRLKGVAARQGLPDSPSADGLKLTQREVPGLLVFDVSDLELFGTDIDAIGHVFRGYSMRLNLDVAPATAPKVPLIVDGKKRQGVALVVRSFAAELDYLRELVLSCEWFLPLDWPLIVVLDDAEQDKHMGVAGALPNWVQLEFEAPPGFLDQLDPRVRGPLWAMWSQFWSDNYTTSEFVVLPDSDSLFHTPGIERLLFQDEKPVIWAQAEHALCFSVVDALGLKWVAEFMSYLPFVVHAAHMPQLRAFVQQKFGTQTFAEAFVRLHESIGWDHSWLSMQSVAGAYLYHYHHDEYYWSVKLPVGTNLDWAVQERCPAVRAMTHLGYWGLPQTKLAGREYSLEAHKIIARGICLGQHAVDLIRELVPDEDVPPPMVKQCPDDEEMLRWGVKVYFSWQTFALQRGHYAEEEPHCRSRGTLFIEHMHYVAKTFSTRIKERNLRRTGWRASSALSRRL